NPGGLLDQAVNVSDLFLEDGLILTQRSRNEDDEIYRSNDGDLAEDVPLVVLINGGSASAAEVVAGALYDRERATLIGQTSFGKGLVQHVYDLDDGSQLHVTVSLWFTPNETLIQDQGLAPDITVDVLAEPDIEDDPYIDAALDYFATQGVVELAIDNE
ncbi:MAG: peptidase S41, partial [Anaerolineae bacterium]|nr:peptidase S41 [Anaerolineae bacterium]